MNTNTIPKLKNLNNLSSAIQKHWIWECEENFHKSCDYLQKINYCIQDLNTALDDGLTASMKDVIFVIALVDWIKEAYGSIESTLKAEIRKGFNYSCEEQLKKAAKYFTAIRSFVVAHPLSTSLHSDFGLDGSKICVDIRENTSLICFTKESDWYHLDIEGLHKNAKDVPFDFLLYFYDKDFHDMMYFQYMGCDYADIFRVAELYIDKLYELGRYLNKQKKKDWK